MAYDNCLDEIVTAGGGRIDRDEAQRILDRVVDRAARYERDLSRAEAAVRAGRDLANEARLAAAYERRDAAINAMRRDALDARVTPGNEVQAVRSLLSGTEGRGRNLARSIDAEGHATSGRLVGGLIADLRGAGLLEAVLRRNKIFEADIARELWRITDPASAPATGNTVAAHVAEILHRHQETARVLQNEAGARIGQEQHYITRQSHDMQKVRGSGDDDAFAIWRDFILPRLDDRTFEGVADPDKMLANVWANLSSGIHETSTGGSGFLGSANLGKKLSAERVLHFKDADGWLEYNQRFGRGNIVDSVLRGLESAGNNIALMRALGTNPEFMFKAWSDSLAKAARDRHDFKTSDALRAGTNERILDILTGKAALPANMTIAQVGRWIRNAESMAKLGGVVLSSLPDLAVNVATLRHSGVPLLEAYANQVLAPLRGRRSGETREIADLLGVGIDGLLARLLSRFSGEEPFGKSSKLMELFHRANLLSWWTDSLKTGVGLMLSRNLAGRVGTEFAGLPARLQTTLRRYGIEAGEWDAVRRVDLRAADGTDYLMPGAVLDLPDDAIAHLAKTAAPAELARIRGELQAKLGSYITDTTREAMTEPTAANRLTTSYMPAGTVAGEATRMLMQFKQYPLTYIQRTVMRELRRDGVDVSGIAHLIVATTLLGYVSMTLKELAKGRNPRRPEDVQDVAKLVMAAMVQGGGAGIYGDFLFGEASRMGGGLIGSLAGPAAGTLEEMHKFLTSMRDGSDTKSYLELAGSHGLQLLKSNAPFINMFYTRTALDYFVLHRLQEAMNPGYLRRYEKKVKKENNQTFWLRPSASPY